MFQAEPEYCQTFCTESFFRLHLNRLGSCRLYKSHASLSMHSSNSGPHVSYPAPIHSGPCSPSRPQLNRLYVHIYRYEYRAPRVEFARLLQGGARSLTPAPYFPVSSKVNSPPPPSLSLSRFFNPCCESAYATQVVSVRRRD